MRWRIMLGPIAAVAAALGGLYYVYDSRFYPTPPTPSYPKPRDLAEAQRQDVDYARHVFVLDRSWSAQTLAVAKPRMDALEQRAGTLSPLQFSFALAEIVALADNGHTTVGAGTRASRANRVPVRLFPFTNGIHVVRAEGQHADLLGAKLLAVDSTTADEIVLRARAFSGGPPHLRDASTTLLLESPEQLHALRYAANPDAARYLFRMADGSQVEREIAGVAPDPKRVRAYLDRWLSPDPIEGEPADWRSWIVPEHCPLAFQEPDLPFRVKRLDSLQAVFVQFRENQDANGHSIAEFIVRAKAEIEAAKPRNIVLDMRMNSGGDYTTTAAFMRGLPQLVPSSGRVFALTSPTTFSAGISGVAFLKAAGGDRIVIVGEPVGDRLVAYGEGGTMVLPNSGDEIRFATGLHDYQHGCRWFGKCFWVNWVYSVAIDSLAPDISAPLDGSRLAQGHDPALDAIADAMAR